MNHSDVPDVAAKLRRLLRPDPPPIEQAARLDERLRSLERRVDELAQRVHTLTLAILGAILAALIRMVIGP